MTTPVTFLGGYLGAGPTCLVLIGAEPAVKAATEELQDLSAARDRSNHP